MASSESRPVLVGLSAAGVACCLAGWLARRWYQKVKERDGRGLDGVDWYHRAQFVPDGSLNQKVRHHGSCLCNDITFDLNAPARLVAVDCSCRLCTKKGRFPQLPVKMKDFHCSLDDEFDRGSCYPAPDAVSVHQPMSIFCKKCGVALFVYTQDPFMEEHGWFSVNVHLIDATTIDDVRVVYFDGGKHGGHCE